MIESLLMGRRRLSDALIDIDFSNAALGSRDIPDQGKLGNVWTRKLLTGTHRDGVVDVPNGLGRGYYFDGLVYFLGNKIPPFSNAHWRITARVVPNVGGSGTVLSTGNYPSSGGVRAGFNFAGGQYPAQYWQHFQTQGNGMYQRTLLDGPRVADVVDTIIITRTTKTIIRNERTGKENIYDNFNTGGDSYIAIGSCQDFAAALNGYLLSLKVEALP